MNKVEKAEKIYALLRPKYPQVRSFLNFSTTWELLVATVLSAQCTDERVNMVTPPFFERWPDPEALMDAPQEEVEEAIRSTGFFRNKAKNLIAAAGLVVNTFGGQVPKSMDDLLRLPGVARKTANIVLTQGYGIVLGIAVDTHVKRLAMRLGLTDTDKPDRIERDLCATFDREVWGEINHLLIQHGRAVCIARKPLCSKCVLADFCPRKGVKTSG